MVSQQNKEGSYTMKKVNKLQIAALLTAGLFVGLVGCSSNGGGEKPATEAKAETKDAGHGHDYRTFITGGDIKYGQIGDSYTAELVMYLAGNQFMVMEELIQDFQAKNPDIKTIYVETIPNFKRSNTQARSN